MRVLLHPGVLPAEAWRAWSFDPLVVLGLITAMLIYARGLHNLWSSAGVGRGVREWQAWAFAGGILILVIALVSPVHAIGGALFSVHMSQHVLLMGVAAPLLVMGAPLAVFTWSLPRPGRRATARLLNVPALKCLLHGVSRPAAAWLLHAVAIWVWHVPALYGATVTSELTHAAQHTSFMVTALLFWWSLRDRASSGIAVLSLFTTAVHSSLLGALLAFSPGVVYTAYDATAPAWGMSALEDQQLGGMIMWVPAGLVYFAAALLLLARWLRASEQRVVRIAAAAALAAVLITGCEYSWDERHVERAAELERGRTAAQRYGCGACHEISGIAGATGRVGPPLTGFANRVYIAGYLPNEPENLVGWIMNPAAFRNPTAMPVLGVTEPDARDIAAYLYSLR